MTLVPLPDTPCLRVRLLYAQSDGYEAGSRFYISYGGSTPTAADCATIAADIFSSWTGSLAMLVNDQWDITQVDVLDIATRTGLSGQSTASPEPGTRSGTPLPSQCASNVEYDIARRYRGGKPRMYLPPGVTSDQLNAGTYNSTMTAAMETQTAIFFNAIAGYSLPSAPFQHVNLSYYHLFTNVENSSGRMRAAPTYRDTALHDNVNGYSPKARIGSQRRRRQATTF